MPLISKALLTVDRRTRTASAKVQPVLRSLTVTLTELPNLTEQGCRSSVQGPKNPLCIIFNGYLLMWEAKKNMVIMVQEEEYR